MKKITGLALVAVGLLHSLIALVTPGLIGFSDIWTEILDARVIDAVNPESLRILGYYWFLIAGFLSILYGFLCYWVEHQLSLQLPPFAGWGLLTIASFGIVLDLDTGLWAVLLIAINAIVASHRSQQSNQKTN
ncbi:MAG: hypothetical protein HC865_18105 [Cyanobacteria bacterium RU_5_0]|nr:hypothetical protein [Cyanobacteria bacterium RU_5_0]